MIRSKSLKGFDKEKEDSRLAHWWKESKYTWRLAEIVSDSIYSIQSKWHDFTWIFEGRYRTAKKMYQWYKNVFQHDYDFDAHGIYRVMWYKLKRVYPVLENGHAIQEDKDMKALRIAIKLAERLADDDYESAHHERHNAKWGDIKRLPSRVASFDKHGRPASFTYETYREGAKTPELKEQETKEFLACYERAAAQKLRDQKNLFSILTKYTAVWWD